MTQLPKTDILQATSLLTSTSNGGCYSLLLLLEANTNANANGKCVLVILVFIKTVLLKLNFSGCFPTYPHVTVFITVFGLWPIRVETVTAR